MTIAGSNLVGLKYVEETTWGTTPATPTMQQLRHTGESLQQQTQTIESAEIRSDRNTADVIRVDINAAGDINFELSYGTFDDLLEGAFFNSWTANVLKNGTERHFYTIEKEFTDLTNVRAAYRGMMVNQLRLQWAVRGIVSGSFSFFGKNETNETTTLAAVTTPATTSGVMNVIDHITSFSEGGGGIAIIGGSMDMNNNLRPLPEISSLGAVDIGLGALSITGTLRTYFRDASLFTKYLAFTETSHQIVFDDGSNSYTLDLPAVKYTDAKRVAGGKNQDIIADLQYVAKYDSGEACMAKLTRA